MTFAPALFQLYGFSSSDPFGWMRNGPCSVMKARSEEQPGPPVSHSTVSASSNALFSACTSQ